MARVDVPPVVASCGATDRLTVAQEQMLALHETGVDAAAVNLGYALRVDGPLDVRALAGALAALTERHETLRTRYGAVVETDAAADGAFREGAPVGDEQEAVALAQEQRVRPFELAAEPPLRLAVHRMGRGRHLLLLTLHHIAADGWSMRVLGTELSALYRARVRDEPAGLPELPLTCAGYAARQRRWLAGEAAEAELAWWRAYLDDARCATLTPGRVRDGAGVAMTRRAVAVPDELTAALRTLARRARVSTFVLLQAAFGALLASWTGHEELVSGTLAANRVSADSAALLGAHYNPLLLRSDLRGDPTLAECVLRTATSALGALDHQALPYPAVVDALRAAGWDADAMPAAMLLLDRYPVEQLTLDGCVVTGLHVGDVELGHVTAASTAEISFCVREVGDRLTLSALHAATLDEHEVAQLTVDFVDVLSLMCEAPDLPLSELPGWLGRPRVRGRRAGAAALHDVADTAPVDALSPVGRWDRHR
jgi:hypothetical protein